MGVPATPGLGTVGPMTRVSRALAVTASALALTLPAGAAHAAPGADPVDLSTLR